MIKQTVFKLITTLALLACIGGCTIKSKEQTKQVQTVTSSSTKEDKEVIKQKQLGYANESKLTNFRLNFTLDKNKIPKIDSIGSDSLYRVEKK